MKRRILLVDDELAILLTLKAVLEISGFDVDTAASAREAKMKIRAHEYHMVITDMRMESETAGMEVVAAARKAVYKPAVTMLTAFPEPAFESEDGADKMLVKPMHTTDLLRQIEALLVTHEDNKRRNQSSNSVPTSAKAARKTPSKSTRKAPAKAAQRKPAAKAAPAQKVGKKAPTRKLAKTR